MENNDSQLDKQSSALPVSRRKMILAFGGIAGVGIGAGVVITNRDRWFASSTPPPVRSPIPHAKNTGNTKAYTLQAAPTSIMLRGRSISTWAYNDQLLGPEIRLMEGDRLRVVVTNRLSEATTIHWHGIPLDNQMDGVPDITQSAILPGEDFVYEFVVPIAGTCLYHSHVGLQLDRGLVGPLIVESARETLTYDQDVTLVLDDWRDGLAGTPEEAKKQLIAEGDAMHDMHGSSSEQVAPDLSYPAYLVNGKTKDEPFEVVVKTGQRVRLRLINAASATIFRFAIAGHRLTVTHSDGLPVEPVEVDTLRIGMGERYDVLVTASMPGLWQIAAQVEGLPEGSGRALLRYEGSDRAIPPANTKPAELTGTVLSYAQLKAHSSLPTILTQPPNQTISIQLSGGMGQYVWKINNQVFERAAPIVVMQNQLIRFDFENTSMMPHPMHLHGHFFQVDNGTERGPFKDTVLVDPMQRLSLFWVADNSGTWAFHCHQLYHQETGMMSLVQVQGAE